MKSLNVDKEVKKLPEGIQYAWSIIDNEIDKLNIDGLAKQALRQKKLAELMHSDLSIKNEKLDPNSREYKDNKKKMLELDNYHYSLGNTYSVAESILDQNIQQRTLEEMKKKNQGLKA